MCSLKEKLLATLECEQKAKKDLANLLDLETEQLKKTQVELETERKKVRVPTEVLNILTHCLSLTHSMVQGLPSEVYTQLIMKCPAFIKPEKRQFNPVLTSTPCFCKIHLNIVFPSVPRTEISNVVLCTASRAVNSPRISSRSGEFEAGFEC
jgi:hypothetical protein